MEHCTHTSVTSPFLHRHTACKTYNMYPPYLHTQSHTSLIWHLLTHTVTHLTHLALTYTHSHTPHSSGTYLHTQSHTSLIWHLLTHTVTHLTHLALTYTHSHTPHSSGTYMVLLYSREDLGDNGEAGLTPNWLTAFLCNCTHSHTHTHKHTQSLDSSAVWSRVPSPECSRAVGCSICRWSISRTSGLHVCGHAHAHQGSL